MYRILGIVLLVVGTAGCLRLLQRDRLTRPTRHAAPPAYSSSVRFVEDLYEVRGCQSAGRYRGSVAELRDKARAVRADTVVVMRRAQSLWDPDLEGLAFRCRARNLARAQTARAEAARRPVVVPKRGKGSKKPLKVALVPTVFDKTATTEVPAKTFDDAVMAAIAQAGAFEVIGQSDIEALISLEEQKDLLGCDDVSCFAEIGGALGVPFMVAVRVARIDDEWTITSKGIDIRQTKVLRRSIDFVPGGTGDLLKAMPEVVESLLRGTADPRSTSRSKTGPGSNSKTNSGSNTRSGSETDSGSSAASTKPTRPPRTPIRPTSY